MALLGFRLLAVCQRCLPQKSAGNQPQQHTRPSRFALGRETPAIRATATSIPKEPYLFGDLKRRPDPESTGLFTLVRDRAHFGGRAPDLVVDARVLIRASSAFVHPRFFRSAISVPITESDLYTVSNRHIHADPDTDAHQYPHPNSHPHEDQKSDPCKPEFDHASGRISK